MKQKLFALAFLLTAGLTSCNNDEELVKANTDYVEPGTAVIATSFYSIQTPGTKAIGDPTAAFDDEKEIKSIAFFVQVADDINLQRFESTEAVGSIGGLVDGLKEESVGNYTARFKMKMDGNNTVNIYALANYDEYGLNLSGITTTGLLKAAVSKALTDADKNPEKPLLMLGEYTATLDENKRYNADFKMDRLVARIDVINEAYNADAAKGFRLESVCLLNAKSESSLLPDQYTLTDGIAVLPQMAIKNNVVGYDLAGAVTTTEANVILQRLDTLYAYENRNLTDATAVQISGTFNGTPVAQRVEFLRVNQSTGVKEQLPIGRNNLYTVKIRPSQDSTTLSFKIDVEDWTNAKGDTLVIEQKNKVPVVNINTPTLTAATWTAATKRVDITAVNATGLDALAGTITFTAEGNQDSKIGFAYQYEQTADWLNTTDLVAQGNLEGYETKAGDPLTLKRQYTIDLSKIVTNLKNAPLAPSDGLILIQNINNADLSDTIRIRFRPDYEGIAGAQAVLMKDGKYWAPINVGATTTTNRAAITGNITAACGQLFQWGRYSGVDVNSAGGDVYAGADRPVGVDGALPAMTTWDGKHIKASTSSPNTQSNWLQFVAGEDNPANMVKGAWYQQLWNANEGKLNAAVVKTDADPCPKGWRVPTLEEWIAIGADNSTNRNWSPTNYNITVPGKESGKNLLLPAAGYRNRSAGASSEQGAGGNYWSSSVPAASANASYVSFGSAGKLNTSTYGRANGFSVRCIQE